MKILLPFPRCEKCYKFSKYSYHRGCGGVLEIETTSDEVYCRKCKKHWGIWDSNYYCSCGNCFEATEIRKSLTEVLVCCRICAEELAAQETAKRQRLESSQQSLRAFFSSFFEKLGYSFGVITGTIIEIVTRYVLKK